MSDQPPGPGWWKASDGNWYPPQAQPQPQGQVPGTPPPPASKGLGKGCLFAAIGAFVIFALIAVVAIVAVTFLGHATTDKLSQLGDEMGAPITVDPSRPDTQKSDKLAELGQPVELSGYTTSVDHAGFVDQVSEFEKEGYVVADVTIANRDAKSQPYNIFDWRLQTPDGQVIDPTYLSDPQQLGSGDLVQGGKVSGKVAWKVGATKGEFFVIYKPDFYNSDRGVWKVSIS
ncbi:MAG: hypothetical protein QOF60_1299 [Actinomycetota bacterium]|jgi:hypothetical protein|nr:hypothetical protein [Actinomycetota bacterium]